MKRLFCIAIDDEPIALLVISQFCKRIGGIDLTTFSDPLVGIEEIKCHKPDLVFLDIEMNNISGLDIARVLPQDCALIFTTAHAQYAIDGFNLDAVDFLHKPFAFERFQRAVDKAIGHIESKRHKLDTKQNAIIIKLNYNNVTIPINDILYIQAEENYIKIIKTDGNSIMPHMNIKSICKILPEDKFIRVHRSFVIPVNKVIRFSKQEVQLTGMQNSIPVGRHYANDSYTILLNNKNNK